MVEWKIHRGQSLVEMALLLPVIFAILAMMLQLLLVVHLNMKLHRSAMRMAERLASGERPILVEASMLAEYRHNLRWGVPIPTLSMENLGAWRQYKGVSTATKKNQMAVAQILFPLTPSWFASIGLRPIVLHARAELPCEPSDMADPS